MEEGKSTGRGATDEEDCHSQVGSVVSAEELSLDSAVRDALMTRAKSEDASQTSLAATQRLNNAKEDLLHNQETPNTDDNIETLMQLAVEINEAAKLEKFANTANNANTNDYDVPSNAQTEALVREQQQQQPDSAPVEVLTETSESREEEIMKIVAGRATSAVVERLNAKEDLHNKEINEAAKMGENEENAANANTNDDVPSDAQKDALVREQQDTVPGNTEEPPTAVDAVPQAGLWRTTQMQPQSQPGAFLGAPGQRMQRNPNLNYGLLGANSGPGPGPQDSSGDTVARMTSTRNEGLVHANAVEDDTADLMHANPVDLETAQQRALQRKQQQNCFFAAFLWLLLVAAIVVGFVVGTQKNKYPDVVVLKSTEAPTVYGSMEPSEVPSSAPTGALDILLDSLPDYTLAGINNGSETPQWRAWNWLANHQNITHLPEWRKTQLFALATFFYAFQGESWHPLIKARGWMDDTVEECNWFSSGFGWFDNDLGIFYDFKELGVGYTLPCNIQGQFTRLYLQGLDLSGHISSLPPEIALLTSLDVLFFSDIFSRNIIAGPISSLLPTELYHMTSLTALQLQRVQLTGQIPSEIALLTALLGLVLPSNRLTGHVPSELGLLTSLKQLVLDRNQLTGQFPSELGLLTSLQRLRLDTNQFTGLIPSELFLLTSMSSFDIRTNRLTGPVPSALGQLTDLAWLVMGGNRLTGQVPSEFGLLMASSRLELHDNRLTGPVPSELGKLTALKWLYLNQNQLTGPVPSELGKLTALKWLNLNRNQLTGQVPSEVGEFTALTKLRLNGNQFTGSVPTERFLLTSLQELYLSDNQFTGTIQTEIGVMTSLTSLRLHTNNLTGTLPSQLNASMGLKLYGNQLSGTVPEHLCSFLLCDCSLNETPLVATCADLKAPPAWPGRFPTTGLAVMLNIHTDGYPEEASWVWQKATNVTGIWDTMESVGPLEFKDYLYSSLFPVNIDTAYRLVVSDSWSDGFKIPGWITLMAETENVLYSYVSIEEPGTVTRESNFTEIIIDVLVGTDGSFDIAKSVILCYRFC
ncbi:expressed unknown protein [Seminavis robusta]|uniref:Disease resistance R13L4/SHOC-2-like LRR domain-containing protein n=1 Tax=Seminavis robusta TaxID=568900 RepID=A0A9N8HYE4_9STRA|nr:expressed unknown protein [Seminavis robusta]|eukprot:Sro2855_g338721.1  (1041) ;mRNA; r:4887-8009